MDKIRFKLIRWIIAGAIVLVLASGTYISLLAYPVFLFPYDYSTEALHFYSDVEFDDDLRAVADSVVEQVSSWEIFSADHVCDIFICGKPSTYNLVARMSGIKRDIPGFNLSVVRNSFVSVPRVMEIHASNEGYPRYSVFEGSLLHSIAHELHHDFLVNKVGFRANRDLPAWKREGLAEYQASLMRLQSDTTESLSDRIDWIDEQKGWSDKSLTYFRWRTVTEYLFEIEACTLDHYLSDAVDYGISNRNMMRWHAGKS